MDHPSFPEGLPAWNDAAPNAAATVLRTLVQIGSVTIEAEPVAGNLYMIDFGGTPEDSDQVALRIYAALRDPAEIAAWLNIDPGLVEVYPAGTSAELDANALPIEDVRPGPDA